MLIQILEMDRKRRHGEKIILNPAGSASRWLHSPEGLWSPNASQYSNICLHPASNQENENITHFLTLTIIEWIDIFTKPKYFHIIIDSLKYCRKNKGLLLYEFAIMTNHLHLIAKAAEECKLSQIISDFKVSIIFAILKNKRNGLQIHFSSGSLLLFVFAP